MEPGALAGAAGAVLAVVAVVTLVLLIRAGRSARARRDALAADLARSRADVDALSRRVTDLAAELSETRRVAAADREYVITSLGGEVLPDQAPAQAGVVDALLLRPRRPQWGRLLEDRLVDTLRGRDGTRPPRPLRDVVVRTVALGHGVRRALSPDILDRAAAESQVARRHSRRARRKELRDARRLLRSVKAQDVA